jgi:hypothetical protein
LLCQGKHVWPVGSRKQTAAVQRQHSSRDRGGSSTRPASMLT